MAKANSRIEEKRTTIEMPEIHMARIFIEGDTNLCLNKMSLGNRRDLPQYSSGKAKKKHNEWGDYITSIHWEEDIDEEAIYDSATKEKFYELLEHNRPCISGYNMKKACAAAVVRNNISQYSTAFMDTVNIVDELIPIEFAQHSFREFPAKVGKGSMIVTVNQFSGWKAEFNVKYIETAYSFEAIMSIINLCGFGTGVGSGTNSNMGRFHITKVESKF